MASAEPTTAVKGPEPGKHENAASLPVPEHIGIQDWAVSSRVFDGALGEPPLERAAQILGTANIVHSANGGARIVSLRRAQQTYGNRFAQRVVARVQRQCACGGTCEKCSAAAMEEQAAAPLTADAPSRVIHAQASGRSHLAALAATNEIIPADSLGEPMRDEIRRPMEARFGEDFGDVRLHTDPKAAASAKALDANAYTTGRDIYFAAGKYAPEVRDGQRLLAHELTHVVQQRGASAPAAGMAQAEGGVGGAIHAKLSVSQPGDPDEQEADHVTDQVMRMATPAPIGSAPGPLPARAPSLRRIARDKGAQAAPAPASPVLLGFVEDEKCYVPKGPTTTFEGILLASNTEYLDEVLRNYIAKHGESAASDFVKRFRNKVAEDAERLPGGGAAEDPAERTVEKYGTPEQKNAKQIAPILDQALATRLAKNKQWLVRFEAKANEVVLGMLQESEDRVNQERIRYGVSSKEVERTQYRMAGPRGMVSYKASVTEYSMQDTPGSRALAEAATGLLQRKHAFDKAQKEMEDFADQAFSGATAFAELGMERGYGGSAAFKQRDRLNELRAVRNDAKRDLDVFRTQKSAEFPILAAYASDEEISESSLERLEELAKGKSFAATDMIGKEIKSRLQHIAEVRKDILEDGGKETKIWRVPRIIEGTRAITGATPGTMYGRLVDDKVKDEAPGIWTSILIGLLQLVLVLLAPVTGGLSLIPAAAISVAQAYHSFREYERAQMLHGTDFGAMALSAEDPSLFWLAVDIVGAAFDVGAAAGAALRVFRTLAPAARAVTAAKGAEATEVAAKNLERIAGELGGETLAKTVGRDARAEAMRVGETVEEAKALERAGAQLAEEELRVGAEEFESIAGRIVKVSESGSLWSCASPCTLLRERYSGLLGRKGTNWETRLKALEDEAAKIPKGKAGAAARKDVAQRAASLEKEMRTTAMPGEWTSPLDPAAKSFKGKPSADEFKDLVERRGSVAAELDHHPTKWTGKDEAHFRYGEKIEAEPGYRWTLDENGGLRYDRVDATKYLPRRYNPATGLFEDAAEGSTLIKATKGAEETRELATIPKKQREAMEAAFKERGNLIAERDRLEALEEAGKISTKDSEKLRKIYAQVNEQSRQLGENAAEAVMKGKGGKKIYPTGKPYSTSGDFDQVWKAGDEFHIVEAKGGSSGLGSRAVGEGVRAEQGTIEYAKSIAENMAKHGGSNEIRKLGDELLAAIAKGKVKYILVRAPIGEELGSAVLRDVKVSEFVIK
jgi:Domain of unknown function (DUF4157)